VTKFKGVFISLLTPMTNDYKVDYKRLGELCEWLISKGVDGLMAAGPMAEETTLSNEERRKVVETVIEVSGGRVPIIVGAGGVTATKDAIYWAEHAKNSGADGILVYPSFDYSPMENEIIAHFKAVSIVGLPIIAINNPRRADLSPSLLVKISKTSNIVGIMDFSQDIRRVHEILEKTNLEYFVGADNLAMEGALCGATGWASAVSNALPEEGIKLFQLSKEGKRDEARRLYRSLVRLYHYDTVPQMFQALKYMMELAGQPVGPTRPPRLALTDDAYMTIKEEFEKVVDIIRTKNGTTQNLFTERGNDPTASDLVQF
jgi:1-pyrroline-4-hydroxy-2-carboxylate deaminase